MCAEPESGPYPKDMATQNVFKKGRDLSRLTHLQGHSGFCADEAGKLGQKLFQKFKQKS